MTHGRWVGHFRKVISGILVLSVVAGVPGILGAQSRTPEGPALRRAAIEEADLSDAPPAGVRTQESQESGTPEAGRPRAEDVPDELPEDAGRDEMPTEGGAGGLPLVARVTEKTTPQRAASLMLIEEGRQFLAAQEYKQALGAFERSIAVDATNPYSHYFVARAHFFLGNYPESFNFLDVAESLLGWHKRWLAEIYVLRGRNATAMGFLGRADTNYLEALERDPYNRFALEQLTTIDLTMERRSPAP